jgi:hypothetical protein
MSWLVPAAGPVRDRLAGVIAGLAAEHGAPVFAPHVTMAGVAEAEPDAAARVLERVVAGVPPFDAARGSVAARVPRAPAPVATSAAHRLQAGDRAGGLTGPGRRPHHSLPDARDLREQRKPAIADGLALALPVTIRVDAAEIWGDFRDEVTRWRRVARVVLTG